MKARTHGFNGSLPARPSFNKIGPLVRKNPIFDVFLNYLPPLTSNEKSRSRLLSSNKVDPAATVAIPLMSSSSADDSIFARSLPQQQSVPVYGRELGKHSFSSPSSAYHSLSQLFDGNPKLAVGRHEHFVETKSYDQSLVEAHKPQKVIIDATVMPLTIYFRSTSSTVKVIQEHQEGKAEVQHSESDEEPHRLFHEVRKPIIQEIHEVISPYRKIVQEMRPVHQDVQTIISRHVDSDRVDKPSVHKEPYLLSFPKYTSSGDSLSNHLPYYVDNSKERISYDNLLKSFYDQKRLYNEPVSNRIVQPKYPNFVQSDRHQTLGNAMQPHKQENIGNSKHFEDILDFHKHKVDKNDLKINHINAIQLYKAHNKQTGSNNSQSQLNNDQDSTEFVQDNIVNSSSSQESEASKQNQTEPLPAKNVSTRSVQESESSRLTTDTTIPSTSLSTASPFTEFNGTLAPNSSSSTTTMPIPLKQDENLHNQIVRLNEAKRNIRLGYFSLYGINLIPYIYDKFTFNIKVGNWFIWK